MEKISWKDNALADYIAKCASGFIQGIPQDLFLVKKNTRNK
jgi:hypothetical protein